MPEDKERLGKSLGDLLKDESLLSSIELIQKDKSLSKTLIPLDKIVANPYQPRQTFDPVKLNELAASIKEHGVFTPILVRLKDGKYEIVAGERRFRASKLAGLTSIPAIIEQFDDQLMSEIALIENIQRENLSALEEANAYAEMQKNYGYTQQELAKKVGKSRSYIANILRLRQLPKRVQKELLDHNLSVGHVRTLVGLKDEEAIAYLEKIKKENLTVREAERLVQSKKKGTRKSSNREHEKRLTDRLHAKVTVSKSEIKIKYSSKDELRALLKKLMNEE